MLYEENKTEDGDQSNQNTFVEEDISNSLRDPQPVVNRLLSGRYESHRTVEVEDENCYEFHMDEKEKEKCEEKGGGSHVQNE